MVEVTISVRSRPATAPPPLDLGRELIDPGGWFTLGHSRRVARALASSRGADRTFYSQIAALRCGQHTTQGQTHRV